MKLTAILSTFLVEDISLCPRMKECMTCGFCPLMVNVASSSVSAPLLHAPTSGSFVHPLAEEPVRQYSEAEPSKRPHSSTAESSE